MASSSSSSFDSSSSSSRDSSSSSSSRDSSSSSSRDSSSTSSEGLPSNGLRLWLDADDASTITLNGSNVSAWADKSGNILNVEQTTPANQPVYNLNSMNGRNTVEFDGDNDYLDRDIVNWQGPMTFFLVYKSTETQSEFDSWFCNDSSETPDTSFQVNYNASDTLGIRVGATEYSIEQSSGNRLPTVLSITADGANSLKGYINGLKTLDQTLGSVFNPLFDFYAVGRNRNNDSYTEGLVAEILLYDRVLSTSERYEVEAYLADKWLNDEFSSDSSNSSSSEGITSSSSESDVENTGLIAIYQDTNNTQTIGNIGVWEGVQFNNTVREDSIYNKNVNNTDITIDSNGKYLLMYEIRSTSTSDGRHSIQSRVLVNGVVQDGGYGYGYARNNENDEGFTSGAVFIDVVRGQDVRVEWQPVLISASDVLSNSKTSLMLVKLPSEDKVAYGQYFDDIDTTAYVGTVWQDITFNTKDETDTDVIEQQNATTVRLKKVAKYLVKYSFKFGPGSSRTQRILRTTLGGTAIEGSYSYVYERGNSSGPGVAHALFLVDNTTANQDLILQIQRGNADIDGTGMARVVNSSSLEIMEVPWHTETIITHDSTGGQDVGASTILNIARDVDQIDTNSYTQNSNAEVQVNITDDYLFMGNGLSDDTVSTSGTRLTFGADWFVDDVESNIGGHGNYKRGSQGGADTWNGGFNAHTVLELTAGEEVELRTSLQGQAGGTDLTVASQIGLSAIRLSTLADGVGESSSSSKDSSSTSSGGFTSESSSSQSESSSSLSESSVSDSSKSESSSSISQSSSTSSEQFSSESSSSSVPAQDVNGPYYKTIQTFNGYPIYKRYTNDLYLFYGESGGNFYWAVNDTVTNDINLWMFYSDPNQIYPINQGNVWTKGRGFGDPGFVEESCPFSTSSGSESSSSSINDEQWILENGDNFVWDGDLGNAIWEDGTFRRLTESTDSSSTSSEQYSQSTDSSSTSSEGFSESSSTSSELYSESSSTSSELYSESSSTSSQGESSSSSSEMFSESSSESQ